MLKTPVAKLSLIVGCLWLAYMTIGGIQLVIGYGDLTNGLMTPIVYGFIPVAILWKLTGVWQPVVDWFKSRQ
jgi:hypothetical protein